MSNPRILVALPNYAGVVDGRVNRNRMALVKHWTKLGLETIEAGTGRIFVQFARVALLERAKDEGCSHLLFLDDDAVVPHDILERFLEYGVDIVGAPYAGRTFPHEICVKMAAPPNAWWQQETHRNMRCDELDQGLIECMAIGTHCMLINMDVFGIVPGAFDPAPVVEYHSDDESFWDEWEEGKGVNPFVMPRIGTEDMYFCHRARRKGFDVCCDTDTWADHVGPPILIGRKEAEWAEAAYAKKKEEEAS